MKLTFTFTADELIKMVFDKSPLQHVDLSKFFLVSKVIVHSEGTPANFQGTNVVGVVEIEVT